MCQFCSILYSKKLCAISKTHFLSTAKWPYHKINQISVHYVLWGKCHRVAHYRKSRGLQGKIRRRWALWLQTTITYPCNDINLRARHPTWWVMTSNTKKKYMSFQDGLKESPSVLSENRATQASQLQKHVRLKKGSPTFSVEDLRGAHTKHVQIQDLSVCSCWTYSFK